MYGTFLHNIDSGDLAGIIVHLNKIAVITAYRTKSSNQKIFVIVQIMRFLIVEIGYDTFFKITVWRKSV